MSLHSDLLEQAKTLAKADPRRPKQANLRRAVSTAYYAVFHLLISEASALYAKEFRLAARITRTFNHGDMKKVSQWVGNNKLPKALQPPGGGYVTPADVKTVADTFVDLQRARHEADYDLLRKFSRKEALDFIKLARQAFQAWNKVKKSDDARLCLACFQLWKQWDQDPR